MYIWEIGALVIDNTDKGIFVCLSIEGQDELYAIETAYEIFEQFEYRSYEIIQLYREFTVEDRDKYFSNKPLNKPHLTLVN